MAPQTIGIARYAEENGIAPAPSAMSAAPRRQIRVAPLNSVSGLVPLNPAASK
jgi:hypothetical protein